jgi:hypothetical protein
MPVTDRFVLTPDATEIIDRRSGMRWNTRNAMRILFAPEPGQRRLAMDSAFAHPMLRRGTAYDQDPEMPPRCAAQEQQYADQAAISGSDCLQFVQLCVAKLAGPERDEFLMGLTDLLSTEEGASDGTLQLTHRPNGRDQAYGSRTSTEARSRPNQQGWNGPGTTNGDRGMRGARTAKDAVVPSVQSGQGYDRRPAQDAAIRTLNHNNFQKRWGAQTSHISLNGNGRQA